MLVCAYRPAPLNAPPQRKTSPYRPSCQEARGSKVEAEPLLGPAGCMQRLATTGKGLSTTDPANNRTRALPLSSLRARIPHTHRLSSHRLNASQSTTADSSLDDPQIILTLKELPEYAGAPLKSVSGVPFLSPPPRFFLLPHSYAHKHRPRCLADPLGTTDNHARHKRTRD